MKTYLALLMGVAATLLLSACGGTLRITSGQKTELMHAAQTLTDAAFVAGGPLLTEAVQTLPAEAQLLVQAGYGALRKAVEVAEAEGISHLGAQNAIKAVADTADALHDAVHAPEAP